MIRVQAGDVGFTRGTGLLQRAIRYATRGPNEEKTWANHVLLFTTPGTVGPAPRIDTDWGTGQAWAIEALARVEENHWYDRHKKEIGYTLRVYRPTFLTPETTARLVETARAHVGERYGWWKLLFHGVDRFVFNDRKVLSQFLRVDSRPICSYLVARAFQIAGYRAAFGPIVPAAQDPDEMLDWVDKSTYYDETWKYVGEFEVE